ncbi:P-loop containing nucleoside triphosphate hydrolase protein [Podospora appendiculata]|uniref:P-loop containing nucleoside triphosphate hydrolase protein n=1 Tax=Podospora appendiculata TaxID=314037 RepID=A0AAE1CB56_9PEZI|nr:P-loop containing nucleoside triphosphate hydrolase protein [Podospora appendiculata]
MQSFTAHHPPVVVDETTRQFFAHSSGQRINTDAVIAQALTKQYPSLSLVIAAGFNLLGFASAGHATLTAIDSAGPGLPSSVIWKGYLPPARRIDGSTGTLIQQVEFAKVLYKWDGAEFIVYVASGRDGAEAYPLVRNCYILTSDPPKADALILAAGRWANQLHDEIWVFDGGYWSKSAELFQSVKRVSWDAVILDEGMKKALINDHLSFFDSRATYDHLQVPWKRGIIYYGPPGNGKTISIKAMTHTLHDRADPVPALYVRSFSSFNGPEYSIRQIFTKARELAPCYLIFEDLDSIVSDDVRSYFLNEVDGLKGNDGIFMIGSTNHLDRLDPGISKRPSRFDRKYLFSDPDVEQRIAYCHFWQRKLADNKDIEFPDRLCTDIADITDGFSFAYMQEAFVAALLAIANGGGAEDAALAASELGEDGWVGVDSGDSSEDGDEELILWVEIQKQVAILREGMDNEGRQ